MSSIMSSIDNGMYMIFEYINNYKYYFLFVCYWIFLIDIFLKKYYISLECVLLKEETVILKKKLNDIESIMISENYNYTHTNHTLKYDGLPMEMLKEISNQLGLPKIQLCSTSTIAFILRTLEQLIMIRNIVEPVYLDFYETDFYETDGNETDEMLDDQEY
jgi:hypothetical protein